ncbi:MAG: hypothetical protein KatS3mg131_2516 [Candidatus Tectimicrobiota bacterium]|nr:MAG: hypothetical protein KatS3mg131_2516 [Candidatus Tectomicrobia bacterium]
MNPWAMVRSGQVTIQDLTPSLSCYGHDAFHLLFAVDLEGDNVRVVTAYRPSLNEREEDRVLRGVDEILAGVDRAAELEIIRFAA